MHNKIEVNNATDDQVDFNTDVFEPQKVYSSNFMASTAAFPWSYGLRCPTFRQYCLHHIPQVSSSVSFTYLVCSCDILKVVHLVDSDVHLVLDDEIEELIGILFEFLPRRNVVE